MIHVGEGSAQGRAEIRDLLGQTGHRPNKHLGQNFLADPNIVDKIVSVARVDATARVVEIGAGTGTLTGALAAKAGSVVAYEIDPHLEPALEAVVGQHENVEIRIADATDACLEEDLECGPWTMVANLPYNVGTGIVLDALKESPTITSFVVMVQREVADRFLAVPGSRVYGLPSVVVGLHATANLAFTVPPQVFEPQPKVESSVIVLDRITPSPLADRAIGLATAAFSQRRKMIRRSLASVLATAVETIMSAGLDPTDRAEDLSPADYVALAEAEGV